MDHDLPGRILRYLERQIAWFRAALSDLEDLRPDMSADDLDALVDRQLTRELELAEFVREHKGLLREWRSANTSEPTAVAVRTRAAEAQALQERLQARYVQAEEMIEQLRTRNSGERDSVRRGRGLLRKYGDSSRRKGDWFDHSA